MPPLRPQPIRRRRGSRATGFRRVTGLAMLGLSWIHSTLRFELPSKRQSPEPPSPGPWGTVAECSSVTPAFQSAFQGGPHGMHPVVRSGIEAQGCCGTKPGAVPAVSRFGSSGNRVVQEFRRPNPSRRNGDSKPVWRDSRSDAMPVRVLRMTKRESQPGAGGDLRRILHNFRKIEGRNPGRLGMRTERGSPEGSYPSQPHGTVALKGSVATLFSRTGICRNRSVHPRRGMAPSTPISPV